jgi:hypothetical protein
MNIIFFSPLQEIKTHALKEAVMAKSIKKEGHQIFYVSCNGIFSNLCIPMSGGGLSVQSGKNEKETYCKRCKDRQKLVSKFLNCKIYFIDDFIDEDNLKCIDQMVTDIRMSDIENFKFEGLDIARYSSYEIIINRKKNSLNFKMDEWLDYKEYFKNSLITFFAMKKILKLNDYNAIFIHNGLYSINRVTMFLGKMYKINSYVYDRSNNFYENTNTLSIARESSYNLYFDLSRKHWSLLKNRPCSANNLKRIEKHLEMLFNSKNPYAFSTAKTNSFDLRKYFNIANHQKIVLAAASSYDEFFSAITTKALPSFEENNILFPKLEDWFAKLIEYFTIRPDFFLIIRIHPREAKLIAGTKESENIILLKHQLMNLPANIKVNWPDDNVSLYDTVDQVDLFLSAWSNIGLEMALLGKNVLLFSDKLVLYPPTINHIKDNSIDSYLENISDLLKNEPKDVKQMQIYAFRWYDILFNLSMILIKKSRFGIFLEFLYKLDENIRLPKFNKIISIFGIVIKKIFSLAFKYKNKDIILEFLYLKFCFIDQKTVKELIELIKVSGITLGDIRNPYYNQNNNNKNEEDKIKKILKKFNYNIEHFI